MKPCTTLTNYHVLAVPSLTDIDNDDAGSPSESHHQAQTEYNGLLANGVPDAKYDMATGGMWNNHGIAVSVRDSLGGWLLLVAGLNHGIAVS